MNKLFILEGQSEELLAVLQNDNSGKCPFFDAVHTEQLNKDHTFEFSVPADHEAAAHVKENNLVAFKDEDGDFQLFQIYKIEEEHNGTEIVTRADAEHAFFEMNDDIIEDLRTVNGTANSAMDDALSNSRFKKGTVADLGLRTTNFYYESAISSIQKIISTWGGELKKRINFDGSAITGRFVDLLARRGADTGKRFEFTKDLVSIKRTVDTSNLKTALYGRGKGEETEVGGYTRRIDFTDVVWNGSGIDPVDKPFGQKWVGDPVALERFGRIDPDTGKKIHRFGIFEDGEETDSEALLDKTWNALQSTNTPRITYEMNVLDLEQVAGLSHEKVRLGDTVFVIDKEFKPALRVEARVIEIKRDLANPENTEIILGNFLPLFTDLASRLKSIESKVDGRTGVWDDGGGEIDDSDFADITPKKPVVTATGAFSKVIIEWDAEFRSYIKEYEVFVSTVPGFIPDDSNLVARTVASVFTYEGAPNQQYYVRVRGVNRADAKGPISDEKTATTARIGSSDLADLLVTAEKLAGGAVGNNKLDRTSANKIVIDSADIKKAAVGSAAIADLAVGTGHIQNLAVTNGKIANLAVDTAKIADLAVTNAKIGDISATKITSDYLNVARIDVRAQLGANISTAEEGLYGWMKPYTLNGEIWYAYSILRDWIYLMEDTDSDQYNRPAPNEGDEIAFDFMLYAKNTSGTAPSLTATITVYFEGGGSWTDPFLLHQIQPVSANTPTKVQFSRKIPEGAYSDKKPIYFTMSFYTTTSGTQLYVKDTDVRIRLRGNLIVQGDIEVKNLKAWEGLNVNDQFMVDENGNVKFAGTLEAGVSINSPTIRAGTFYGGDIRMYGETATIMTMDDPNAITEITTIFNGSISQDSYAAPGDYENVRSTYMRSGRLDFSNGVGIREKLREDYISYLIHGNLFPYEYKYEAGDTIFESGLLASDIVGVKDSLDGSITGYPMYIHADRLGVGLSKVNATDPEYKGLILDIREDRQLGKRTLLSSPNGMKFNILNSGDFVFKGATNVEGKLYIKADSDLLQLIGDTHCYVEFFKGTASRSAYFGYGSSSSNDITLRNEIAGGNIYLFGGSGNFYVGQDSGGARVWSTTIYNRTITGSANMIVANNGSIGRASSARKYKINEQAIPESEAKKILELTPKLWFDRFNTEAYASLLEKEANGEAVDWEKEGISCIDPIPGLIAEDVYEAGLKKFVTFSDPNEDGERELEGIHYDRLPVLFIPLFKELFARVEELESKIEKDGIQ
ncbi:phage tail spike protein [Cytobacillus oceanisediminis]|uniref:phage tail spike protein n=1 Tax=Cytobacillus oceanisediminis TaxID=665099 RepID=UPI001C24FEED|nr:phage tail spike protein [Cytobacillus oceanisediminis]MBU8768310.1 phage tail protein [Cytobacillus oceanisediminis]